MVGPAYIAIAARYRGNETARPTLVQKIISGGSGVWGPVPMPAHQTGSPMSYMVNGRQYIAIAVSSAKGAELLVYALP